MPGGIGTIVKQEETSVPPDTRMAERRQAFSETVAPAVPPRLVQWMEQVGGCMGTSIRLPSVALQLDAAEVCNVSPAL